MTEENIIEIQNLSKKYGKFEALKAVNLTLKKGELFSFIGPNGAGKTTLIRILTGIIKPTSGDVLVKGKSLLKEPSLVKPLLGYVPDRPYLYEKLSPYEYFEFTAGIYNVPLKDALERCDPLLEKFKLYERRNDLIESFSHGMKQKIAIIAAVLHDPEIFIIDEPTVGLDPYSVKVIKQYFKELTSLGKTVFLTTHALAVAQDVSDRICIINKGSIVALGKLDEVQNATGIHSQHLEELFLQLTQEETSQSNEAVKLTES